MPSLSSVPCMTSNHKHCVKQVELELWLTCLCVRARTHMYVCVWGGGGPSLSQSRYTAMLQEVTPTQMA